MLRFDSTASGKSSRPPAYLSRGQQMRMLSLVGGLAFVLIAMNHLRQPAGVATVDRLLHGATTVVVSSTAAAPTARDAPAVVPEELLATIVDNTFFRKKESDAWFAMLAHVRDADTLTPVATAPLSYAQLTHQPQAYRGRAVNVAGTVRRIEQVTPGENQVGIETLYRLVLQGRGGETWPITLYALQPPADVPLGEEIDLPIEATGLFFKNWSYRHQDGLGISPVVLTREVQPIVASTTPKQPASNASPWAVIGASLAIATLLLFIFWRRTTVAPSTTPAAPESVDFSHLSQAGE